MRKNYRDLNIYEKINLKEEAFGSISTIRIRYTYFKYLHDSYSLNNIDKPVYQTSISEYRTVKTPKHRANQTRINKMLQRSNFLKVCYELRDKELLKRKNKLHL